MLFQPPDFQLLQVPHIQQKEAGECLDACAAMVCAYLGIRVNYRRLVRTLRIQTGVGAPLSHIEKLNGRQIKGLFQRNGTLKKLYQLLESGWPTIVGVQTREFPHWNHRPSRHAVVVIGMDSQCVYINDPEMPDAPTPVSIGDFDLAWFEQNECYAVLSS